MAKGTADAELACSFCGERQPAVKLIAGPSTVICSDCVGRCIEIAGEEIVGVQSGADLTRLPIGQGTFSLLFPFWSKMRARRRTEPACDFCGMSGADLVQPPSTLGRHGLICGACLRLCLDIIQERL